MFCPNCGEQVQNGTAFCANCGTAIDMNHGAVPAAAETVTETAAPVMNDLPDAAVPNAEGWVSSAPRLGTEIPEIQPVEEPAAPQLKSAGVVLKKPVAAPVFTPAPAPAQPVQYTPAPATDAEAESLGSSSLTFGILSMCFCWVPLLSIMALVFGAVAKKKANYVRARRGEVVGKCKVGHILGCIGLGCSIGMTVFWPIYILAAAVAVATYRYW